jgi:regulator of nonsense transcripts 2
MNRGGARTRRRQRPVNGAGSSSGAEGTVTNAESAARSSTARCGRKPADSSPQAQVQAKKYAEDSAAAALAEADEKAAAEVAAAAERETADAARFLAEEEEARARAATEVVVALERVTAVRRRRYEEHERNVALEDNARPSDAELRRLDASLKKCTGFVRKIRAVGLTEESVPALVAEASTLNLSKFISEVVSAVSEARVKGSDAEHAAHLCGEMHRRYAEFAVLLASSLVASVTTNSRDVVMRRGAFRLMIELVAVAVLRDPAVVVSTVNKSIRSAARDITADDCAMASMSLVATFAKTAGRVFLPKLARPVISPNVDAPEVRADGKTEAVASISNDTDTESMESDTAWEGHIVSSEIKKSLAASLRMYSSDLFALLSSAECELQAADAAVLSARMLRGVDDEGAIAAAATARRVYDRAFTAAVPMSEALALPAPVAYTFSARDAVMGNDLAGSRMRVVVGVFGGGNARDRLADVAAAEADAEAVAAALELEQPFESDQDCAFYSDLPVVVSKKHKSGGGVHGVLERHAGEAHFDYDKATSADTSGAAVDSSDNNADMAKQPSRPTLEAVMTKLSSVDDKELCDMFVLQFCTVSESNRTAVKRLTRQLVHVPSQMLNILPVYARVAASLQPRFPDIAAEVVSSVEEEMRQLVSKTDHNGKATANFIKASRYTGELVKFKLLAANSFFELLGVCVRDFTGHKVEIACHLLETCGRYLYRSPATSVRMGNYLDTVWRLKSVKNLEARYNALVETAYFASRPQGSSRPARKKRRDPLHEYIRFRIYTLLDESNVDWTAAHFRKLPWDDELEIYVAQKFLDVCSIRFSLLRSAANLLAGLCRYRNSVGVMVCDGLLEAIHVSMERNDGRDSQRRIAEVALLGELFNFGLVSAHVVYQVLYQFITLGHALDPFSTAGQEGIGGVNADVTISGGMTQHIAHRVGSSAPDPHGDFFRLRLVCTLLDTCGSRLLAASTSKKRSSSRQLEVFWIYFERYALVKAGQADHGDRLPLHMEHIVADTYERIVRPLREQGPGQGDGAQHSVNPARAGQLQRQDATSCANKQSPNLPALGRSQTFEQAVAAVVTLESNPVDVALVQMPVREFVRRPDSQPAQTECRDDSDSTSLGEGSVVNDDDASDDDEDDVENDVIRDSENDGDASTRTYFGGESDGDDEDDDENLDENDDEDEEDAVVVMTGISNDAKARIEEEIEFEKELAAFMAGEVQSAKQSFTGHRTLDRMAIPIGLMAKRQEEDRQAAVYAAACGSSIGCVENAGVHSSRNAPRSAAPVADHDSTVAFKVLVRRGGKSQVRDLDVPSESLLAVKNKESESQGVIAQEEMKRLVLESSTVMNGGEDDHADDGDYTYNAHTASKQKVRSISEQRAADETAVLRSLFRSKPR